jgi:hypothetical protein
VATIAGKHAIDELETALRASFDRDTIAVYGDQLQASGEPRGELIAIDLRIDDTGAELELARRRAELIRTWLGTSLPHGTLRYGFVGSMRRARIRRAGAGRVRGPGGTVRSAWRSGLQQIAGALAIITRSRAGARALTIRQWSGMGSTLDEGATRSRARAANLDTLELDGRRVLPRYPHERPRLLPGFDAIDQLRWSAFACRR